MSSEANPEDDLRVGAGIAVAGDSRRLSVLVIREVEAVLVGFCDVAQRRRLDKQKRVSGSSSVGHDRLYQRPGMSFHREAGLLPALSPFSYICTYLACRAAAQGASVVADTIKIRLLVTSKPPYTE